MGSYGIAEAKAHFSALIAQVERGDVVTLTKRGKPVARIVSLIELSQKPKADLRLLRAFRSTLPKSKTSSAVMIRKMRDEEDGW